MTLLTNEVNTFVLKYYILALFDNIRESTC